MVREFSEDYLSQEILYEVKLDEDIPGRGIGICSLKGVSLSPSSEKFVEYLVK